jgi:hypothetical protein
MRKSTAQQKYTWFPPPPVDISKPYSLGNYEFSQINTVIARKYLSRPANLKRAWSRICTHFPETTNTNETYKFLEFSTAHGAMLETWEAMGHSAEGTDYCVPDRYSKKYKPLDGASELFATKHTHPVKPEIDGWIYQPLIESIGCKVHLFDASKLPYAFEDKSFDYICCYQAIEAYAKPADWGEIVTEFCRIARRAVVIGFNPPPLRANSDENWEETKKAWEKLRTYDENGFKNQFFEFEETNRGFHPSACKLVFKDGNMTSSTTS